MRRMGFPFEPINGLKPIMCDTRKTGKGFVAQPSILSLDRFVETVRAKGTRFLGKLAGESSVFNKQAA